MKSKLNQQKRNVRRKFYSEYFIYGKISKRKNIINEGEGALDG